jgi:hypothetical protein
VIGPVAPRPRQRIGLDGQLRLTAIQLAVRFDVQGRRLGALI